MSLALLAIALEASGLCRCLMSLRWQLKGPGGIRAFRAAASARFEKVFLHIIVWVPWVIPAPRGTIMVSASFV